jgi:hypothetical protein
MPDAAQNTEFYASIQRENGKETETEQKHFVASPFCIPLLNFRADVG